MPTFNGVGRVGLRAAAVLALAVSMAACASEEPASPEEFVAETTLAATGGTGAVGDPGACTHVDAPMLDIPTASDTEPRMRIPQPPGWGRSTELDNVHDVLRYTLVTTDLGANQRPQNVVVVSLEPVPAPDADADARAIFDHLRADLVKMLDAKGLRMDLTTTAGTVCGLPAETITFAGADVGLGGMTAP